MAAMTDTTGRLLLLDTASLYFRAFFGVPEVIGPSGVPTNAVRGLLDMIATLVERSRPSHLAACWDNDWRPAFRVEAIPTYKTHRVAGTVDGVVEEQVPDALAVQVPVIVDALTALGIARVGVDGHEGEIVGHYAGWGARFRIDGEPRRLYSVGDVATDPAVRGLGGRLLDGRQVVHRPAPQADGPVHRERLGIREQGARPPARDPAARPRLPSRGCAATTSRPSAAR